MKSIKNRKGKIAQSDISYSFFLHRINLLLDQ